MEFFIYAVIITLAIYLYFLESKESVIAFFLISISLLLLSLYRVYTLRSDFISNVHHLSMQYTHINDTIYTDLFDYSTIAIFTLIAILILLSNIFLLNKKNISIIYIFMLGLIMIGIPLYTYMYARTFDTSYLYMSSYLFRSASYQCLLLQIPFLVKKIFNYFNYTTPFFTYNNPI